MKKLVTKPKAYTRSIAASALLIEITPLLKAATAPISHLQILPCHFVIFLHMYCLCILFSQIDTILCSCLNNISTHFTIYKTVFIKVFTIRTRCLFYNANCVYVTWITCLHSSRSSTPASCLGRISTCIQPIQAELCFYKFNSNFHDNRALETICGWGPCWNIIQCSDHTFLITFAQKSAVRFPSATQYFFTAINTFSGTRGPYS